MHRLDLCNVFALAVLPLGVESLQRLKHQDVSVLQKLSRLTLDSYLQAS